MDKKSLYLLKDIGAFLLPIKTEVTANLAESAGQKITAKLAESAGQKVTAKLAESAG